jgi:diadenosine tetraphosphate (Ap4A) HIT family hydrolase
MESLDQDVVGPLMMEVTHIGRHIKNEFKADRMNYASFGNVVAQLHWHLIPRYEGDPNWGAPPWPVLTPRTPSDEERRSTIERIRNGLVALRQPELNCASPICDVGQTDGRSAVQKWSWNDD